MLRFSLSLILVFFLFDVLHVRAIVLHVPSDLYQTIDAAIDAAEDGDEIVVAEGTYTENLRIDKLITLRSASGASSTIIVGDGSFTTVDIKNQQSRDQHRIVLDGFTISGGYGSGGRGGGISITQSDPIIKNNIITRNSSASHGGGILVNEYAHPIISDNVISENSAVHFGGGMYVVQYSSPLVVGNTFSANTATGVINDIAGGGGAGLYADVYSTLTIRDNIFQSNIAKHAGGAIALRAGVSGIIEMNTIENNQAAYGGGVHFETEGGAISFVDNGVSENKAVVDEAFPGSGFGGGISVYNASMPDVMDNTVYDNTAEAGGAGIVVAEKAVPTISRNTIRNNRVLLGGNDKHGGGVYVADATAYIRNNLILNNVASLGGGISLINGSATYVDFNTIYNNDSTYVFTGGQRFGGGIHIESTVHDAVVRNNMILANGAHQIYEGASNTGTYQNNFLDSSGEGMYENPDSPVLMTAAEFNASTYTNASANIEGDADFVNPGVGDYRIGVNSDALDKALNVGVCNDFNQNERPYGAGYDIGAYEFSTLPQNSLTSLYRFYSNSFQGHFYTANLSERNLVQTDVNWDYEGGVYSIYTLQEPDTFPIYRFWSENYKHHFYTISENEKNNLIAHDPNWSYEGIVYYTYMSPLAQTKPVYRFYSPQYRGHFYTTSESEKNGLIANDPNWSYEGVAWYASTKVSCAN